MIVALDAPRRSSIRISGGEIYHIGQHPGWRFGVPVKLQVTPVLTPVLPKFVPGFACIELPQVNQIAQRDGVEHIVQGGRNDDVCWYSRRAVISSKDR
jgi:hypothetical protein